jgi:hypothetical protein
VKLDQSEAVVPSDLLPDDKPADRFNRKPAESVWQGVKSLTEEKEANATQAPITERKCFGQFGEYEECRPGECKDYEICKREHVDCYKGIGA